MLQKMQFIFHSVDAFMFIARDREMLRVKNLGSRARHLGIQGFVLSLINHLTLAKLLISLHLSFLICKEEIKEFTSLDHMRIK